MTRKLMNYGGFSSYCLLMLCLFVGFEAEARAYTDPGTGALIWQMVAAGFVGALFYVPRTRFLSGYCEEPKSSMRRFYCGPFSSVV